MPYQGSAQSIGFRNRTVIDPSKRKREEAQQLKERGREQVRGMETQASQQIKEMQRVGDLQAKNAEYELKALSKFSKTIESFVTDTVVPFVEERKEEERFNQELSYYLQDAETLKAAEEEVDASIAEGQRIHIALNAEANKVDDPEIEDRIRAASNQHTRGWQLANLREKANGWGTYLISELDTSEVRLKDERTGQAFAIKDAKDAYQKELAVRYLQANYIKENRGNLSAKVVVTKLVLPMSEATKLQRRTYQTKFRQDAARQKIDSEENSLATAFLDSTTSFENKQQALVSYLTVAPSQYKITNPGSEQFAASRNGLLNMVKTMIKANPDQAQSIIDVLKATNMPNHPAGPGTLFDHYKDEFNEQDLLAAATDARIAKFNDTNASREIEAKTEHQRITAMFNENHPTEDERRAVAQQFNEKYPLSRTLTEDLADWTPQYLGVEASEEKVAALKAAFGGELPKSEMQNIDRTVYNRHKNSIVDHVFGSQHKDAITEGQRRVKAAIKAALKISLNDTVLKPDALRAIAQADKEAMARAKDILTLAKENGQTMDEGQAILLAFDEKADEIAKAQSNKDHDYYAANRDGFDKFQLAKDAADTKGLMLRRAELYNEAEEALLKDPNALLNTQIIKTPDYLELNDNGSPKSVFYQLAELDGKHNAWEILNAQRRKAGEKELTVPSQAALLQSYIDRNPAAKDLFYNKPSYQRINRGLQSLGTVSAPNLLQAIGFQESGGGNYQAYNDDAYGPSNPALGKYQILWTTALDWSRRAGYPPPVSKQAFRDDHEFQEKLASWAMGEYVRQAMAASGNNPRIAIRMAAAMWYGGAGMMNYYDRTTKETGGRYPSMREYTTSVLNHYLAG